VILVDVNLPVHAVNLDSPFHTAARDWWDEALSGVYSTDIDFARFSRARWRNPVLPKTP